MVFIFLLLIFVRICTVNSKENKKNELPTEPIGPSSLETYEGPTINPGAGSKDPSPYEGEFTDPLWKKQWYIHDYRTKLMPVMNLNVVPVYRDNITGKGIKVAIVDIGVDGAHDDLSSNYVNVHLSFDPFSNTKGSPPVQGSSHGTQSAAIVSMVANNNKCGIGIAYDAKVAGITNFAEVMKDHLEYQYNIGKAFLIHIDQFDIYSNSWGVDDSGKAMDGIEGVGLVKFALKTGTKKGRGGKGAIYTIASGNGGANLDHCGADYLVNLEQMIAIGGVSQTGQFTDFGEQCAGIFAATYSGNNPKEESILGLSVEVGCMFSAGSSTATPIASGIYALMLEANSELTYRDAMHITTMGAEVAPLANNKDTWNKNGKGFWVSHHFGFGLMNAENLVKLAKEWVNVPKKRTCEMIIKLKNPEILKSKTPTQISFDTSVCDGLEEEVNYLEIVELVSTIKYPYRGSLSLHLISPSGTRSRLLENRPKDRAHTGLTRWNFKSFHSWGESPRGRWTIEILLSNKPWGWKSFFVTNGEIEEFTIKFHGTKDEPDHFKRLPRKTYAAFRLPNGKSSED